MPKKHVDNLGKTKHSVNALANFSFVSRSENRHLGGDAPSVYKGKMAGDTDSILAAALCPKNLFDDDYDPFLEARADLLSEAAKKLID